ncbi:unnamed protein product, partial [Closterium sp. NIES-53]
GANFTASEHGAVMMIASFVVEDQVLPIQARALVGVLEWHESFVRAPYHTDRSLTEFDENTRRGSELFPLLVESIAAAGAAGVAGAVGVAVEVAVVQAAGEVEVVGVVVGVEAVE